MLERRKDEIELIRAKYGEVEAGPNLEWVIVSHWRLPPGWNKAETAILVFIPPGYPVTPPDNFYAANDLRLADGNVPGNATPNQSQLGRLWFQFSYHVEAGDWRPHADLLKGHNLLTFLEGIVTRLSETN